MIATRTVTTTGQGAVAVPRDAAVVHVSAAHSDVSLGEALSGAESARAAIVAVAREHVDAAAVASQDLSTWPRQDDRGRTTGYEARHSLRIRCGDLAAAATLLQALADGVGDRLAIDSVVLSASPTPEHLAAAREAAFADARARAVHLADLAGATLGAVQSVSEGGGTSRPPGGGPLLLAAKADVAFEGGSDDVGTSVTVTWELG